MPQFQERSPLMGYRLGGWQINASMFLRSGLTVGMPDNVAVIGDPTLHPDPHTVFQHDRRRKKYEGQFAQRNGSAISNHASANRSTINLPVFSTLLSISAVSHVERPRQPKTGFDRPVTRA